MNELEKLLREAMEKESLYEIHFIDYEDNQWTAPVLLSEDRIHRILTDNSVDRIRLILTVEIKHKSK